MKDSWRQWDKSFFLKVFPVSSFSIAALLGAAAIRNQVAAKLGWNVEDRDEEDQKTDEPSQDMKRRLSIIEDEDIDEVQVEMKKFKNEVNDEEEVKTDEDIRETPYFLEKLRLAKTILENRNRSASEGQSQCEARQSKDFKIENMLGATSRPSSMSSEYKTSAPVTSSHASDSFHSKQTIINCNSKLLDKVNHNLINNLIIFWC